MKHFTWFALVNLALSSCYGKVSLMPNPSMAWLPIGETKNGDIISIDTGTLAHRESQTNVWVRIDYKKPQALKQNATQFYASFKCSDRLFTISREVQLGTMGETIQDQTINNTSKQIIPVSTEGIVFQRICWDKKADNR